MAKSISRTVTYDQPVEKVLSAVTSEEFQIAQRKTDAAVVEAEYREVRRTDQELLFEVHSVEYERGMTGLDKKKTVKSVMSSKWDLTKLTGTWTYTNEATDRFKLGGTDRLERAGDGTRAAYEISVEVKIPLMGKKIEGLIAKEIAKQQADYDAMVLDHCKKV
jgi:hypothetical protein